MWAEFVSRFHRPITLSVVRTVHLWGRDPREVVEDLVQETYLKLCADGCRLLNKFALEHPEAITGYVKTIAVNVVQDHFKALTSQKRGSGDVPDSVDKMDPRAGSETTGGQGAMEREVLLKQIDKCLDKCSEGSDQERDRMIFWLYYQQGMSAQAIATLPTVGLTAKGVESAIFRLTRLVREQIVGLRAQPSPQTPIDEKRSSAR